LKIFLYNEGFSVGLFEIARYIEGLGLDVEIKGGLIKPSNISEIAPLFARAKVVLETKEVGEQPLPQEIEYEKKRLKAREESGFVYDGFALQEIFRGQLGKEKTSLNYCNIIFINSLLATYSDRRYHLRVSVYGFPSIISIPGIIEAPALPREYYIKKHLGIEEAELKEEFKGRFIEYSSPYIPEILKGYALQAIFFHLTGFPFCSNLDCRLYNAHWQEEVINSQIKKGGLCEKHRELLLEKLK